MTLDTTRARAGSSARTTVTLRIESLGEKNVGFRITLAPTPSIAADSSRILGYETEYKAKATHKAASTPRWVELPRILCTLRMATPAPILLVIVSFRGEGFANREMGA